MTAKLHIPVYTYSEENSSFLKPVSFSIQKSTTECQEERKKERKWCFTAIGSDNSTFPFYKFLLHISGARIKLSSNLNRFLQGGLTFLKETLSFENNLNV